MNNAPEPEDDHEEIGRPPEDEKSPILRADWVWILPLGLLATVALVVILAIYASNAPEPASASPTSTPTRSTPTPTPTSTPTSPTFSAVPAQVVIDCGGHISHVTVDEEPDFSDAWEDGSGDCTASRPFGLALTDIEREAYDKAGYGIYAKVEHLYEICATADPESPYLSGENTPSAEQVAEIRGALILCPDHPLADELKAAAERGERDAKLRKEGRIFGPGTFLVGKEIKPGTYVVTGDIEGCYWERQDRNGDIIDNYFSMSARRVVVNIQATDYVFTSERCGEWRPA